MSKFEERKAKPAKLSKDVKELKFFLRFRFVLELSLFLFVVISKFWPNICRKKF